MGHFVVMPTFHPAAALRNPAWQELLEADFRMLGDYLARHPQDEQRDAVVHSDALPRLKE